MKDERIKLDLSVFSLSRSGSTLIENFLDQIFINPNAKCRNGVIRYWKDTESTNELSGKCSSEFLIINIRDFRDMAASSWRIRHAKYKDGMVINKMSIHHFLLIYFNPGNLIRDFPHQLAMNHLSSLYSYNQFKQSHKYAFETGDLTGDKK